jgi:hypothetical protein
VLRIASGANKALLHCKYIPQRAYLRFKRWSKECTAFTRTNYFEYAHVTTPNDCIGFDFKNEKQPMMLEKEEVVPVSLLALSQ